MTNAKKIFIKANNSKSGRIKLSESSLSQSTTQAELILHNENEKRADINTTLSISTAYFWHQFALLYVISIKIYSFTSQTLNSEALFLLI